MTYTVYLTKGDSSFNLIIKNVNSITHNENVYIFYNEQTEVVFTAPLSKVIAIVKE